MPEHDRHRQYRLVAGVVCARVAHDPGSGAVLRRPEPVQGRAQHDDDELRRPSGSSPSCGSFYGFTLAFGTNDSAGLNDVIGSFTPVPRHRDRPASARSGCSAGAGTGIPTYVFMAFQMMFAIITVALISGAISDRAKFAGWLLFAFGWFTLVYFPVAHWVWGGGFIGAKIHALDFAGGTAVHINAGAAALGAGARARQADRLAAGRASSRTTCRSSRSAPACCGSAGSASTPAPS